MKNNIKIHRINNQEKVLIKRRLTEVLLDFPHTLNHPASKLAIYNSEHSDLKEPHTPEQIKAKIGHKGNDKQFKKILNIICETDYKNDKIRGRPNKLYKLSPDKIQKKEEQVWELLNGEKKLIEVCEEAMKESITASDDLIKHLKTLPEEQRLIEIEQFIEELEKEAPSHFADKGFKKFFSKLLYNWTLN